MGMDASYLLHFTTAEAARTALETVTVEDERETSPIPGSMMTYNLGRHGEDLLAAQVARQHNVVSVGSLSRWMDPDKLQGDIPEHDRTIHRAPYILAELEFLTANPAFKDATVLYGSDYHDVELMSGWVPITEGFMDKLRGFVAKHGS